jgi:uncharacterized protein with FMN-binding domain
MRASRVSVGAAVVAAAAGLTACGGDAVPDPAAPSGTPRAAPSATSPDATVYRDGEYSATGWYGSLPSHHDVTLSIEDGTVTALEISTLAIDRLAGSSGCSEGFMDALAQIREQAQEGTP